jgi:predicted transcriptional regulator
MRKFEKIEENVNEAEIKKIVNNSKNSKSSKIKQLFDNNLEISKISKLLNIRYNFAYNVISNYIITNDIEIFKETKNSKKTKIIELFNKNMTKKQISIELKTNYNYIYKVIKDYENSKNSKNNENKAN